MLETVKQYGNQMTHFVTISLVGALLGINTGVIPTEGAAVGVQHNHTEFAQIAANEDKLDRILEIQLIERLEKLHRTRCMGDSTMNSFIIELEAAYRDLTEVSYVVRPCAYYLTAG